MNYLLYFLSIFSLSQASILTRWSGAPIEVLGFWRLIFAAIILRLIFLGRDFFKFPQELKVSLYVLAAGIFLYLHFWTFFYAAQNTSIANTVILFSLNPLTTSAVAWFFLKDKMTLKIGLSFLLGLGSVVLLFYPHLKNGWSESFADVCALISALFYSVYVVTGKKGQLIANVTGAQFASLTFVVAGTLFFIHCWMFYGGEILTAQTPKVWGSIVLLTLVPTLLGHALFLKLTPVLNINWMSAGKLLEAPMAAVSAFFAFGQAPSSTAFLSFAFLIPALVLLLIEKEYS